MYKDSRYINAGENEIYRYGKEARAKVEACKEPHNGFYSIPTDAGRFWTLGTSEGKFGEYIKFDDTFFSVNRAGFAYAKSGTEKGKKFEKMLNSMIEKMLAMDAERLAYLNKEED